ncbi:hypothetical protein [Thalassobellus suaedae]|uniref:Lipoprotein n=1 Tax=Thalassobellus suaedae TaxID=3074124 RepID=A0ABY9Y4I2_9FLAO|nr:hypothetical protein RHP49_00400 [Flavobacteriaceae bacterium HL-DH10]
MYINITLNQQTMKALLSILVVFMLFNCTNDQILEKAKELTRDKNYKVGLTTLCESNIDIKWVCVSKTEFERLHALPVSCNTVLITSLEGNKYSGIINDLNSDESTCLR